VIFKEFNSNLTL
jgi:hypothetical protein